MEVIELIYAGVFYILLSIVLIYRVAKGPNVVDRAVASDSIDIMTSVALILFSLYSGRGIYLDIALIIALLGFIGTVLISRYLEGRL
ncbi:monovalent cation/H+ antiporter complex subunit F [Caloramator quimbayensis]|uniref:monovalent cation/H+ antiporter complex subunit F n=1 Tax=Caloramator quimbayensis TaxID=1147123 RepID=UPI0015C41668|nr:monovalent cation/H+ antiporter complex subunit F [Caloramator quimbayensis]